MDELTEYKHAHDYWEAEAKRLRAELAEAKLERDTALTDRYDTIQDLRAEIVAKDARITWLKGLLDYATDTDAYRRIRARTLSAEARVVDRLEALCRPRNTVLSPVPERAEAERGELRKLLQIVRDEYFATNYYEHTMDKLNSALAPSKESKK